MTIAVETDEQLPDPTVYAPDDLSWRSEGACVTLPARERRRFFAGNARAVAAAKRVCDGCPVQMACLDYALVHGERGGVWGGTDEEERRRVARGVHGTPERYRARRCRCVPCREAFEAEREALRELTRLLAEVAGSAAV